jgi:hypothetical protein
MWGTTQASPLNEIAATLKTSSNPMATIQQMASMDPRMQDISNVIQQNGSIQNAVYALSRQKGVDPNVVLQQARELAQSLR